VAASEPPAPGMEQRLAEIMIGRVIAIPHTATLLEACELFVVHKYLAFPIVDEQRRVVGLIDVGVFTEEVLELSAGEPPDDVFEAMGFHLEQVRGASAGRAFRYRFPWLLATIGSGTVCAVLAGHFELTLAKALVLTFFLPLVLALGESVSIQSMTVTIQALRSMRPGFGWYLATFRREAGTGLFLGAVSGVVVAGIVWVWRGNGPAALILSLTILVSLCGACLIGLSIPTVLHACKLDPKIAAGPVTLALTDVVAILTYLLLAAAVL
jgi:magnesium transporter